MWYNMPVLSNYFGAIVAPQKDNAVPAAEAQPVADAKQGASTSSKPASNP